MPPRTTRERQAGVPHSWHHLEEQGNEQGPGHSRGQQQKPLGDAGGLTGPVRRPICLQAQLPTSRHSAASLVTGIRHLWRCLASGQKANDPISEAVSVADRPRTRAPGASSARPSRVSGLRSSSRCPDCSPLLICPAWRPTSVADEWASPPLDPGAAKGGRVRASGGGPAHGHR